MNERLKKLSAWMKEQDVSVCFLSSPDNVFYLSGFYTDPHERLLGLAVFQEEEPFLVCPAMEKNDARNAGWEFEIVGFKDTENPWEMVHSSILKRLPKAAQKVAIEKEHLNVERYEELKRIFPDPLQFVSAEEKMRSLRLIKDERELKALREAAILADYAIEVGASEIKEGKSELEVLAAIEFELKRKGVEQMSFSTMVLAGKNAASPHGNPGQIKIKKGDFVLFYLVVVVDRHCSDITRTLVYGDISAILM